MFWFEEVERCFLERTDMACLQFLELHVCGCIEGFGTREKKI
jgi:hypothetical protein